MIEPLIPPTSPREPDPPERKEVYWTKVGAIGTIVLGALGIGATLWIAYGPWPAQKSPSPGEPLKPVERPAGGQVPGTSSAETDGSQGAAVPEPAPPEDGARVDPADLLAGTGGKKTGSPEPVPTPPSAEGPRSPRQPRQPGTRTRPQPGDPKKEPAPVVEAPVQTIPTVPGADVPPEEVSGSEKPQRDPGFQQGIVVRYVDPKGPRILGEVTLPRLPTDALQSLAAGKELRVRLWVTADGRAEVKGITAPWLPKGLQQRVREHLERRRWEPSRDRNGTVRASEAEVIFFWKR
jgi:hypothetical protein